MIKCPRCKTEMNISIMSKFNTEEICISCKTREENHPKYREADRAETRAVQSGNYNFVGIGCPADLYQPEVKQNAS